MENLFFKTLEGKKVLPVSHTIKTIKENPFVQVYIGTDSQVKGRFISYATVIAFRFPNNGVHYIYKKTLIPRINDIWTRLWKETELSMEIADLLSKNIPSLKITIDMDFNPEESAPSHKLISASKGWAKSSGYRVNIKFEDQIATRAADYQCR